MTRITDFGVASAKSQEFHKTTKHCQGAGKHKVHVEGTPPVHNPFWMAARIGYVGEVQLDLQRRFFSALLSSL